VSKVRPPQVGYPVERPARQNPYRTGLPTSELRRKPEEGNAMAIAALSTTHPLAPRRDATAHTTRRLQFKRTIRRRVRRLPGFLLVLALLLPLLITTLFGSR
jgi:hypothetical protein